MNTTLKVVTEGTPLTAEHERLVRTALRRGSGDPEAGLTGELSRAYSPQAIKVAIDTWRSRMVHEHHSAAVFSRLLPQLMEAEAPLEFKTSVLRMSMDELRHAALCGQVVRFLGGDSDAETSLTTYPLPIHEKASRREAALRNVIFVGCMSETVALALLTEERETTTEPAIKAVSHQLASDESLHARLGWTYLAYVWPQLDDEQRSRTNLYLPYAFGYLEEKMLGAMGSGQVPAELSADLKALGVLAGSTGREIFQQTVSEVIVPRLVDYGLDAKNAWIQRVRPESASTRA